MSSRYTVIVQRSRRRLHQKLQDHFTGPAWKLVGMLRDHPHWIGVVKALDTCLGLTGIYLEKNRRTRGGAAKPPPLEWLRLKKHKE